MRFCYLFLVFAFSVCTQATENDKDSVVSATCDIFFKDNGPCVYKDIIVNVRTDKVADDEKQLKSVNVLNDGRIQTLKIVHHLVWLIYILITGCMSRTVIHINILEIM